MGGPKHDAELGLNDTDVPVSPETLSPERLAELQGKSHQAAGDLTSDELHALMVQAGLHPELPLNEALVDSLKKQYLRKPYHDPDDKEKTR